MTLPIVKYYHDDKIKADEMGRACRTQQNKGNVYRALLGQPEERDAWKTKA
jgi:hypothetical protein